MKLKDPIMSDRVAEEIFKLGEPSNRAIAKRIGCTHKIVSAWLAGDSIPSAYHLKSLHYAGCDVIYILTGRRTRND